MRASDDHISSSAPPPDLGDSSGAVDRLCAQLHGHVSFLLRLAKSPELQSLFLVSQQSGASFLPETAVKLALEQAASTSQFLDSVLARRGGSPIPSIDEQLGPRVSGARRLRDIRRFLDGGSMGAGELRELLWQELVINDLLRRMLTSRDSSGAAECAPRAALRAELKAELRAEVRDELVAELTPVIERRLWMKHRAKIANEIRPQIVREVKARVVREYVPRIARKLRERSRAELERELRPQIAAELKPLLVRKIKAKLADKMANRTYVEEGAFRMARKGEALKIDLRVNQK